MTIADSLILLNNTKQSIKTAIENKGVAVGSAPFADYAGKIGDISAGIELPEIGDAFEGGYFAGVLFLSDGLYANIISPRSTEGTVKQYKTSASDDPGAVDLVDPRTNMAIIDDVEHPAAQACSSLSTNGYSDWLLPSYCQIMWVLAEFGSRGLVGSADNNITNNRYYWSSTTQPGFPTYAYKSRFSSTFGASEMARDTKNTATNNYVRAFRLEKLE